MRQSLNESAYDNFDVRSRERPEYDALGVRMGSFVAYPSIDLEIISNDNIGATPSDEKSDMAAVISPEILLKSDFNNHAIDVRLYGQVGRFFDETKEDFNNYGAAVNGRFDVTRDFNTTVGAEFARLTEDRTSSLANSGTVEPIEYQKLSGYIGFNKSFNRLSIQTSADVTNYNYDDGFDAVGDNVDQDERDINIMSANVRTEYEMSPGYSVFTQGTASRRKYVKNDQRDSNGLRGTAGISAELTNLIVGEIEAGYEHREFDNYKDFGVFVYGAAINWYPTPLMTTRFSVDRNIIDGVDDTVGSTTSGIIQTRYGAQLDYEVLRNLIVSPSIQYIEGDYRGSPDEEESIITGIAADYMINNNFSLRGSYEFSTRDSSISNLNYDRNLVRFGLRSKL